MYQDENKQKDGFNTAICAVSLVMLLVILVAGYEFIQSISNYKQGMSLVDFASYANGNKMGYFLVLILANLIMLPMAILLYKKQNISLAKEIFDKNTLMKDILTGILFLIAVAVIACCFIPVYDLKTTLGYNESTGMFIETAVIGFFATVFVSGICKEIYFRGFAMNFCGSILGEWQALLLFNLLFTILDWNNLGYSFRYGK